MKRLTDWLQALTRLLGGITTALLLLLLLATGWLLMSKSGLRFAVQTADLVAGPAFSVEHAEGRLFGTMRLSGIRSETPAADVDIERLSFGWTAGWLPGLRFHVRSLQIEGVQVALKDAGETTPEEDTESTPLDLSLPLRVVIAEAELRDLRITRDGEALPGLDRLAFSGWAAGRRIAIEQLVVEQPEFGNYRLEARLGTPTGGIRIDSLRLEGPGTLTASGDIPVGSDGPLALQLDWKDLHWPAGAPDAERLFTSPQGGARIAGSLTQPEIEATATVAPQGEIAVTGQWRGDAGFEAQLDWRDFADPLDPEQPLWRSPEGSLQASGHPEDWQAELQTRASLRVAEAGGTLAETLEASLALAARGDLESARIEQLALETLDGVLRATGEVAWVPQLKAGLELRLEDLNPGTLLADFPGRFNGDGRLDLTMKESGPDAGFQLALGDSTLRGHSLSLALEGGFRDAVLSLQRARLQSGQSTLTASGRATPPFDLRATLKSPDLGEMAPELSGSAELQARLRGEMPALTARLDGWLQDVVAAGQQLGRAEIDADIALDGDTRARLVLADLRAGGAAEPQVERLQLNLDGRIDAHQLRLDAQFPQGALALQLDGGADIEERQWDGRLSALALDPADSRVAPLRLREAAPLRAGPGNFVLKNFCLGDEDDNALCLEATMADGEVTAGYQLERLDFAVLSAFLPAGMRIEGSASGEGRLRLREGAIAELAAGLDISEGTLSVPRRPELRFGPGRLVARDEDEQRLRGELELAIAGGELTGDLAVDPDETRAVDGSLALDLPQIDFLPLFTAEVTEAAGRISGRADIGGTLAEPQWSASLQLSDGRLRLFTPGLEIADISARVESRDGRKLTLTGSARSDQGTVQLDGEAALDADPLRAELQLQGQDFQIANLPEARVWISPDLKIQIAETVNIRGRVDVPRAVIEPQKFSGGDSGQSAHADQIIVDAEGNVSGRGLPIDANVIVALGDAVSLSGYGLDTRLGGSITVIEEPNRVTRARGALTLIDGRYDAYGQRLKIERGRIVFAGGPITQPGLDFEAVRTPRENIRVGIRVRGSIDQPEFQLFSDPNMEQNAQLSWLVLGRPPPKRGQSAGDGDAMAAAALAMGLSGGNWIAERLGSTLGVDEISVGTKDGQENSQAQLTVGKYIGTRLYVAYGVSLFQPGHVFRMRYDIGRGFALQTETGVESGGDLLYTLER
ncbi:translocation/assembly module TamB domain-containing protein [Algiphilus aromaticivorans]|uniref:translocation/assembly module TamB domain-containing protein n=1 Tax=Algiphilus aromaticivorans TaxID=382454 RepID=UPI0005C19102|nr:translocation/assembly module TamB domain-containing protein [Algiphilus aromaticivorans]